LVARLRANAAPTISLIAVLANEVIGHILFSPVTITGFSQLLFGLAPVAVTPTYQSRGIGSVLIETGLALCTQNGVAAVFVLGHADYYSRFGFTPGAAYDIKSEYETAPENFMLLEILPDSLSAVHGTVRYHSEFSNL